MNNNTINTALGGLLVKNKKGFNYIIPISFCRSSFNSNSDSDSESTDSLVSLSTSVCACACASNTENKEPELGTRTKKFKN
jgi:hypothetical protein